MSVTNSGMTVFNTNDNNSGWSGTDGPDDYNNAIQGANSESWQVSKNATETAILAYSVDMSSNKYLTMYMSSNLSPYYTDVTFELESSNNNYDIWEVANSTNKLVSGEFHPSVLEIGYADDTSNGTYAPASTSEFRVVLDNSSSGNIRSVINTWLDTMAYGNGRIIGGTTVSDKLFSESHELDTVTNDTYDGCSELFPSGLAFYTDIYDNTSNGVSKNEQITFVDKGNTSGTLTLYITGSSSYEGTTLAAGKDTIFNFDSSGATSFSMLGGSINGDGTVVMGAGQDFSNVVFNNRGTYTVPNTLTKCIINNSDLITLTGNLVDCTVSKSTGVASIEVADLSKLNNGVVISDGSNHAVKLTDIGSGTMPWEPVTNSYDAGSTGSPVTTTNTGNEALYVAVSSGEITINVASSATIPSVKSDGAVVNVVAGQVTLELSGHPIGSSIIVYDLNEADEQDLGDELFRDDDASATVQYQYSGGKSGDSVQVKVINVPNYKILTEEVVLSSTDSTFNTTLDEETN